MAKARQGEAAPPFEKLSNFREVSGLQSGVLFRSDELSRVTERDLGKLREFGIKLICDLRSPEESRKKQPRWGSDGQIRVVNIPLHEPVTYDLSRKTVLGFLFSRNGGDRFREFGKAYYHHIAFERTSRIRDIFTLLSQQGSLPAVIHCAAGKDRTGLVAALIQLLAGVTYDAVREDYRRTNDHFAERLEKFIKIARVMTLRQVSAERIQLVAGAQPEFLDDVHSAIARQYGSVEVYLREACEIEHETLRALKSRLQARVASMDLP